jgi:hypothetical protein
LASRVISQFGSIGNDEKARSKITPMLEGAKVDGVPPPKKMV